MKTPTPPLPIRYALAVVAYGAHIVIEAWRSTQDTMRDMIQWRPGLQLDDFFDWARDPSRAPGEHR